MERIASVTSSYYKFAEAAILVFSVDNAQSFHSLSQHLVDISKKNRRKTFFCVVSRQISYSLCFVCVVTTAMWAESAKIFLCGNRSDLESEVSDADILHFCEQCQGMISAVFKTSCKTNEGVERMFQEIAESLVENNRSRIELQQLETQGFKIYQPDENVESCSC